VYKNFKLIEPGQITNGLRIRQFKWAKFFARFSHWFPTMGKRDAEFIPGVKMPETVADINEMLVNEKNIALEKVTVPSQIPIADLDTLTGAKINKAESLPAVYNYNCAAALKTKN
ncbi:MAG: hypothetical protein KDD25_02825, partial [Bdellovibrionales bacterium]|nr:hypothetical protein [Bdellovibrionales bacterium]